jgi:SAM-dependent methyltransferase
MAKYASRQPDMDIAAFAVEAEVENSHWWFVGRRQLFAVELERAKISHEARILDIGTGTGSTLRMLGERGYSNVTGIDQSDEAIRYCALKGLGAVAKGDLSDLCFPGDSFDFVFATDVLEHMEDDGQGLREISRVLAPGGHALITVPAFMALWGLQDRQAFHKRRYRRKPLLALISAAGLMPLKSYYFNYLLFLPILAARKAIDRLNLNLESENQVNSPVLNQILGAVFRLDIRTAPVIKPPFGVSVLVVAQKPAAGSAADGPHQ